MVKSVKEDGVNQDSYHTESGQYEMNINEISGKTGIELTAEDLRDLIIAYDATNEIEKAANALLNADTSVSTTPDGDSIVGRLNRIWNVIYRHSRFYRYGADGHGGVAGVEAGAQAVGGAGQWRC